MKKRPRDRAHRDWHKADNRGTATIWSLLDKCGQRIGIVSINDPRQHARQRRAHAWFEMKEAAN